MPQKSPDWLALERNVLIQIRLLRSAWAATSRLADQSVHETLLTDLYDPALHLLHAFCEMAEPSPETFERLKKLRVQVPDPEAGATG